MLARSFFVGDGPSCCMMMPCCCDAAQDSTAAPATLQPTQGIKPERLGYDATKQRRSHAVQDGLQP
jgi:hypothetical protein